ncbi:hypothetical protein Cgig2_027441 [Carnegiea gigantea]|uniref:Prolamin-like domain-containing protein n=1 Tax=Carnegiea gigantea TaxID=171969 RepID=A0A9Q1GIN5_9CARY|nr:hypothetical protein Cgig2_027441 [Carnegiea gigantea]
MVTLISKTLKGGFSTEETEEILERNSEVWNLCKRSGHIGGTQAAPATIIQPLKCCAGKVTSACGPKIYEFVFDNNGILSEKCCEQLLNAGRECHDSDTNSILSDGEFSKEEREEILARHSEVWNLCKRSVHIGGTQPVPAPTVQPLTGCAGKVTSACGPKWRSVRKCCELLLNAGRQCHDSETNSILSEGEFSAEEKKEIMKRHNQVWNLCKKNETEEILVRNSKVWNICKRNGHIGGAQAAPATIVQPLKGCAGKVTSACGRKIYEFVFDNSGILSEKCCEQLLNTGRECHDSDTNSILSEGEFSKEEREEVLARHSEVWNLCKRSGHIGGTQPVPTPTVQPLTGCAGKVTSACGPKVYAFVFDKSGVLSEKCCKLLLNAGSQCHDSETNSILSEGEFSAEEKKEIMKRHNQVWNLCKKNGGFSTEETEEILEKNSEVFGTFARGAVTLEALKSHQQQLYNPQKGCAGKVTSACGPKIYEFVFDNSGILSEKCCEQLLNAGRECHDSDTNSILSEGEFSKEEMEEILARHSEVWNLCKRSGHIGGTQPVPAPTIQPLTGCAGKVTSACGPKVYALVFDKSGVLSEKCCELLLNAGRQCHDSETNSILSEGEFSAEERREIMKRHNQVWNLCKKNGHIDVENTCHDNLTNSILSKGGFSTEETEEILERTSEVWKLCKRSGHIGGTQAAPATIVQPLKGCAGKLTRRESHDSDTNSILSEGEFSKEEREEENFLRKKEGNYETTQSSTQAARATIAQPLKGCAGKVTSACGPKIYEFVFDNSGILSEKCCEQLLNAGRECHDSDTNSILREGEFSKEEREEILARHSEVWNLCKRSGHIGGTQPVPAPTVQPLTGCAGKVTSACGPKIYAFVFDKSGVLSEKCCELLLNAGRQCHDSETNSILSEGEFSAEERREIMKRHNQVWNLCKKNGHIDVENTVF